MNVTNSAVKRKAFGTDIKMNLKPLWGFSLILYLFCSTAFATSSTLWVGVYSSYLFVGISFICILLRGTVKVNAIEISMVLYLAVMLFGMIYSPAKQSVMDNIVDGYVVQLLLIVCVCQFIEEKKDFNYVLAGLLLGGFGMAMQVIFQYGADFWVVLAENAEKDAAFNRLGGDLNNVNFISARAALSFCISIYYIALTKAKKYIKLALLAIAGVDIVIVLATASKLPILMIAVCCLSLFMIRAIISGNFLKLLKTLLAISITVIAVVLIVTNLDVFSGISARFEEFFAFGEGRGDESTVHRAMMITEGLKIWSENLFFGAGTQASTYYFGVYTHNNFVEILLNSGIVGFIVFYAFQFSSLFRSLIFIKMNEGNREELILVFSLVLTVIIVGIGAVYFYDRFFMITLAAMNCNVDLNVKKERE